MASKKRQGYQAIPDDNSTDTLEESEDYYHIDNDDDSLKRVIEEINAVNEAKRSGASAKYAVVLLLTSINYSFTLIVYVVYISWKFCFLFCC